MQINLTMTRTTLEQSIDIDTLEETAKIFHSEYGKFGFSLENPRPSWRPKFVIYDIKMPKPMENMDLEYLLKDINAECVVNYLGNDTWDVEIYNDHRE